MRKLKTTLQPPKLLNHKDLGRMKEGRYITTPDFGLEPVQGMRGTRGGPVGCVGALAVREPHSRALGTLSDTLASGRSFHFPKVAPYRVACSIEEPRLRGSLPLPTMLFLNR